MNIVLKFLTPILTCMLLLPSMESGACTSAIISAEVNPYGRRSFGSIGIRAQLTIRLNMLLRVPASCRMLHCLMPGISILRRHGWV